MRESPYLLGMPKMNKNFQTTLEIQNSQQMLPLIKADGQYNAPVFFYRNCLITFIHQLLIT